MEMGYSENRSSHALVETKNNVETAMAWLFENAENPCNYNFFLIIFIKNMNYPFRKNRKVIINLK